MQKVFTLNNIPLTKFMFFTGKGGVGKTSLSASLAVNLADGGKKILLVSTDPAGNLQDIFKITVGNKPQKIEAVPNLSVLSLDPEKAATEYKESVLSMYRGLLPDSALASMDEQLSGSCTVEIAAFNEFVNLLSDPNILAQFDNIIFDTAPTGHTLRMLELPAAWSGYIQSTGGNASCLGQLSGLTQKKDMYAKSVDVLRHKQKTTLFLVARPQKLAIEEAARSSRELSALSITNQAIVFNYMPRGFVSGDALSRSFFDAAQSAMSQLPDLFAGIKQYVSYLRPFNIVGIQNIRALLSGESEKNKTDELPSVGADLFDTAQPFEKLADDLISGGKKLVFTMGKGGVGKSTVAALLATSLVAKGARVHLTTTDPAAHIGQLVSGSKNLRVSRIDPKAEIENYRAKIIAEASKTMSGESLDYIKEDLMSPCTEEIAVFKAFADIVASAGDEVVVIDTAPTGHTLLLLDASQSYAREAARAAKKEENSITGLLPRLRDPDFTQIIIVTLPEATPYYESMRLKDDLCRAQITADVFVINNVTAGIPTSDPVLAVRQSEERQWIDRIVSKIPAVYLATHRLI